MNSYSGLCASMKTVRGDASFHRLYSVSYYLIVNLLPVVANLIFLQLILFPKEFVPGLQLEDEV